MAYKALCDDFPFFDIISPHSPFVATLIPLLFFLQKRHTPTQTFTLAISLVGTWAPKYLYDRISHLFQIFSSMFQTTLFKIATLYPYHSISFLSFSSEHLLLSNMPFPYLFYCLFPQSECRLINANISPASKTVWHIVSVQYTFVE